MPGYSDSMNTEVEGRKETKSDNFAYNIKRFTEKLNKKSRTSRFSFIFMLEDFS